MTKKNLLTTLFGILAGAPLLAKQAGYSVGHLGNSDWLSATSAVGLALLGAAGADSDSVKSIVSSIGALIVKLFNKTTAMILFVFIIGFGVSSCNGQNGPTPPSVTLTWTQSTTPGVTGNCIYRGLTAGTYDMPALSCSNTPITSFKDTTITRGTTYHYAVTAKTNNVEGNYSNDAVAAIPNAPAAPTGLGTLLITENIAPRKNNQSNQNVKNILPKSKKSDIVLSAKVNY